MARLIIIIPFILLVFYFLALMFGMKPLYRSKVHTQIVSRLASKIDSTNVDQSNDSNSSPSLAAMFFMGLILLTIFGLAFWAIALFIAELFK